MALPPPEKLKELKEIFAKKYKSGGQYGDFDAAKDWLKKYATMAATAAVQTALQHGVTAAAGGAALTVGTGAAAMAVFPLGAALGPWLGALAIASKANGIFALHDLKASASNKGDLYYTCTCGRCAEGLAYVIDKKETKVAILAVSVFTVGLPLIVDRLNSVRKSFQSNRPKERYSRQFVESARGGCINAMAAIMMLCGEWKQQEQPDKELAIEALAIMVADNGWRKLKAKW
jgi:hypothetical protein